MIHTLIVTAALVVSPLIASVCVLEHRDATEEGTDKTYYADSECPVQILESWRNGCITIKCRPGFTRCQGNVTANLLRSGRRTGNQIKKTVNQSGGSESIEWCGFTLYSIYAVNGDLQFPYQPGNLRIEDVRVMIGGAKEVKLPNADEVFLFKDGQIDWSQFPNVTYPQGEPQFEICVEADTGHWCKKGNPPISLWQGDFRLWNPKSVTIRAVGNNASNPEEVRLQMDTNLPAPDLTMRALKNSGLKVCRVTSKNLAIKTCWSNKDRKVCRPVRGGSGYQDFENLSGSIPWHLDTKYCNGAVCGFAHRANGDDQRDHDHETTTAISTTTTYASRKRDYQFWNARYRVSWTPPPAIGVAYKIRIGDRYDRDGKNFYETPEEPADSCDLTYFASCAELTEYSKRSQSLVGVKHPDGSQPRVAEYGSVYLERCGLIGRYPVPMVTVISMSAILLAAIAIFLAICGMRRCKRSLDIRRHGRKNSTMFRDAIIILGHKVYSSGKKFIDELKNYPGTTGVKPQFESDQVFLVPETVENQNVSTVTGESA